MSEPQIVLVTLNYQHGRVFCDRQNIWIKDVAHFATSNHFAYHEGLHLTDNDAIIWYGPWMEGKNAQMIADTLAAMRHGDPFEYDAYMASEVIPWPKPITERYFRD